MTHVKHSMSDLALHSFMRELYMLNSDAEKYNVIVDHFDQNKFALLKVIIKGGHVGYFDELLRLDVDVFHVDSAATKELYEQLQQAKNREHHNLTMQMMAKAYDDYLRDRQRRKRFTFVSVFGVGAIALYVMLRRALITKQTLKHVAQSLEAIPLVGIFVAGVMLGLGAFEVVRSITSTGMTHFTMSNAILSLIETLSESTGYLLIALHATAFGAGLLFILSSGVSIFKDTLEYMKARYELNFNPDANAPASDVSIKPGQSQQIECARLSLSACKKQLLTDVICGAVVLIGTLFCFFPGAIIGSAAVGLGMMGAMGIGLAAIVTAALVKSIVTRKIRENLGAQIQNWNNDHPNVVISQVPERSPRDKPPTAVPAYFSSRDHGLELELDKVGGSRLSNSCSSGL